MTIDDVCTVVVETEFAKDGLADFLGVGKFEEGTFLLLVEFLVVDKVTFEGGHLVLVEERRFGTTPEVEHIVERILMMLVAACWEVGIAYHLVDLVEKRTAMVSLSVDLDVFERAVGVHRDGSVEEEVAVAHEVERALLIEQTQVLLEFG